LSIAQAFATAPGNATAVVEAAIAAGGDAGRALDLAFAFGLRSSSQNAAIAMILSSVIGDKGCAFLRPTLLRVGLNPLVLCALCLAISATGIMVYL